MRASNKRIHFRSVNSSVKNLEDNIMDMERRYVELTGQPSRYAVIFQQSGPRASRSISEGEQPQRMYRQQPGMAMEARKMDSEKSSMKKMRLLHTTTFQIFQKKLLNIQKIIMHEKR